MANGLLAMELQALTGNPALDIFLVPFVNAIILGIIAAITIAVSFLVGYYVAKYINKVVRLALTNAKVEQWIDDQGLGNALLGFRVTQIITVWLWAYVITAALGSGFSIAFGSGFFLIKEGSGMLIGFTSYLQSIAPSIVVVVSALFIAKYIGNNIRAGKFMFNEHVALAIYGIIGYFALVSTLQYFLPGPGAEIAGLMKFVFQAVVAALGLTVALAFGLGLKDIVSKSSLKNQTAIEKYLLKLGKK